MKHVAKKLPVIRKAMKQSIFARAVPLVLMLSLVPASAALAQQPASTGTTKECSKKGPTQAYFRPRNPIDTAAMKTGRRLMDELIGNRGRGYKDNWMIEKESTFRGRVFAAGGYVKGCLGGLFDSALEGLVK